MITQIRSNTQQTLYFYAPDSKTHPLFQQTRGELIKNSSTNFTAWIVSTYIELKNSSIDCKIVQKMPNEGIVIADRDTLGNSYPYLGKVMLICAKGDREFHPSAHFHILHNPVDAQKQINTPWKVHYIPHWLQPDLIPRNQNRDSLMENIGFLGAKNNLAKEFFSEQWINSLKELNCTWNPLFNPYEWSDYSYLDLVIAVRSFDENNYINKPASKLINCWQAGVPAIVGAESAFLALKQSYLDFLVVSSLEETINAVKQLKSNPELYRSMIENGLKRAKEFNKETITQNWLTFFNDYAFPEYENWLSLSDFQRRCLFVQRYINLKTERLKKKLGL